MPGGLEDYSIWSIVFDHMGFLWVVHERGIQGYQVSGTNTITLSQISPIDFLSYLMYKCLCLNFINRLRINIILSWMFNYSSCFLFKSNWNYII